MKPLTRLALYIFISFFLLIFDVNQKVSFLKNFLSYIFLPTPKKAQQIFINFSEIPKTLSSLVMTREENIKLKKELNLLLEKMEKIKEATRENERLKEILKLKNSLEYDFIVAKVVGRIPFLGFSTVIIDKGEMDGIKRNLPVIGIYKGIKGLVGRVEETSKRMSKILLVTNSMSEAAGISQFSRVQGVVSGLDKRTLLFKYLSPDAKIEEEEIVISSGLGRIFPYGIKIGKIKKVWNELDGLEKRATVVTWMRIESLEEVLVIKR